LMRQSGWRWWCDLGLRRIEMGRIGMAGLR
jgi:hypothetical protein